MIQPISADSADFGRLCQFRQSLPISAGSLRNYINSHLKKAESAEIGSVCRFREILPILAESAEISKVCRNRQCLLLYKQILISAVSAKNVSGNNSVGLQI